MALERIYGGRNRRFESNDNLNSNFRLTFHLPPWSTSSVQLFSSTTFRDSRLLSQLLFFEKRQNSRHVSDLLAQFRGSASRSRENKRIAMNLNLSNAFIVVKIVEIQLLNPELSLLDSQPRIKQPKLVSCISISSDEMANAIIAKAACITKWLQGERGAETSDCYLSLNVQFIILQVFQL
jgi:hypothetical protein